MNEKRIALAGSVLCLCMGSFGVRAADLVGAVRKFADTAIEHGRDTYGEKHTPLFVDVLNVETLEPCRRYYRASSEGSWSTRGAILSNFANQQNLLRVLVGLSKLTGDGKYRREAERATRYMFEHGWHEPSGLFYWGTHRYLELEGNTTLGEKGDLHEIKAVYPFYEFLYEVDPERTARLIRGIWRAHVEDWSVLTFNRHGLYVERSLEAIWDRTWSEPKPGEPRATGLTFFNAGSDLIYAGCLLGVLAGDEGALTWGTRLFGQFAGGRDAKTLIMPHMSARQKQRERGTMQFKFPTAFEPNLYIDYIPDGVIGHSDFALLRVAERLKAAGYREAGDRLLDALCEHLVGYAKHAYVARTNRFKPILVDGTDLTGYELPVGGYFGPQGKKMGLIKADAYFVPVYALAYRLGPRQALWDTLRGLCKGNGLGDIGKEPGDKPALDHSTTAPFPRLAFALVEIHRATGNGEYLRLADRVCRNVLVTRYRRENGLFTLDRKHVGCHLDCYEPLALLTVAAAKQGKLDLVPTWDAGGSYPWTHSLIASGYSKFVRARAGMGEFVMTRENSAKK